MKEKRLVIKSFHVNTVQSGDKTSLKDGVLTINKENLQTAGFAEFIDCVGVQIIEPYKHDLYVNTIVDIVPIATKALGTLGSGITHTLTGVYVLLTGSDTNGGQMNTFGASNGILKEKLKFGQAGSPKESDYIIHIDVTLKSETSYLRQAAYAIFQVADTLIQDIRETLKTKPGNMADEKHELQGAMYDNLLFPDEPCGTTGGLSIIDMNNMPIVLTPNEYRDGALRALT